jgi:hypothetical protein
MEQVRRRTGGRKCLATESIDGPLVHGRRAEAAVEVDGRLVPIQNCPLQPRVASLNCELGQGSQQGPAEPRTAVLRHDVQVLEIDPVNPLPGGEIPKVEGEADYLVVVFGH